MVTDLLSFFILLLCISTANGPTGSFRMESVNLHSTYYLALLRIPRSPLYLVYCPYNHFHCFVLEQYVPVGPWEAILSIYGLRRARPLEINFGLAKSQPRHFCIARATPYRQTEAWLLCCTSQPYVIPVFTDLCRMSLSVVFSHADLLKTPLTFQDLFSILSNDHPP